MARKVSVFRVSPSNKDPLNNERRREVQGFIHDQGHTVRRKFQYSHNAQPESEEKHYMSPPIFRVSGSDEASSDEEAGEGAEEDDSFIDDRSQVTPSAAGTTPSAGTEASPADMMALYR
jgi:hypothetical protein